MAFQQLKRSWARFWIRHAGFNGIGRLATRLATWSTKDSFYGRIFLSRVGAVGYISPQATISHSNLVLGQQIYIDDRVLIYQDKDGGSVELSNHVHIHRDTIIQTGSGGSVKIGSRTSIQPRCQFSAYLAPINIGADVQIAPACAFYPYNHQFLPGDLIRNQPLISTGGITIEANVWIGYGVVVLDGVKIGRGAVIGAGSVVTRNIPADAIAVGIPARVIKMRQDLAP